MLLRCPCFWVLLLDRIRKYVIYIWMFTLFFIYIYIYIFIENHVFTSKHEDFNFLLSHNRNLSDNEKTLFLLFLVFSSSDSEVNAVFTHTLWHSSSAHLHLLPSMKMPPFPHPNICTEQLHSWKYRHLPHASQVQMQTPALGHCSSPCHPQMPTDQFVFTGLLSTPLRVHASLVRCCNLRKPSGDCTVPERWGSDGAF